MYILVRYLHNKLFVVIINTAVAIDDIIAASITATAVQFVFSNAIRYICTENSRDNISNCSK